MKNKYFKLGFIQERIYWIPVLFSLTFSVAITLLLQNYTQQLLRQRLNERLIAIASTSSLLFNGDDISILRKQGIKSIATELYRNSVLTLQSVRDANKDIMYVYILGQTEIQNEVVFIVDADAASVEPIIDFNKDGLVDHEDVSEPGEVYDATDVPALQGPAFKETVVDSELTIDEWGTFLSAYSPIRDSNGDVVGVLTIDVEVSDYIRIIKATYLPFILFILLLSFLLIILILIVVRIWRSRVEAVQELDRQKDELLSIVSHQLAAPVTAIKWYLELLTDSDLKALAKDQIDSITSMKSIGVDLSDLVSMILDVSRIQLGKMKVDTDELDLNEFFKEILAVIEPKAAQKCIEFIKDVPHDLPKTVLDKRLTRMTIENLLTNAVKYTPEKGKVEFRITMEGGILRCMVKDTGVGIPKEEQAHAFDKLFRASNVRNTFEGNGFGLYVAKGAIEAQGGKIWFESKENRGTTFYVTLPLSSK